VKRPEAEKLDTILEKFAPPENCEYLVVPKVANLRLMLSS
jgi:hypothetical protein